jgi:hypothetical protein
MIYFYAFVTIISLWYNTYIHSVADKILYGNPQEIAMQSILEMHKYDYSLERARDFVVMRELMEVETV